MVLSATIHSISGIPADQLLDHPDNPRRDLGDLTELAASIKAGGILEPPIVVPKDTGKSPTFLIVAGHRRVAAARLAGLPKVPCIIRSDLDGRGPVLETMLVENLQRADLDPIAEARALRLLVDECGYTQVKVSERVGRSQAHVSKRLALLDLDAELLGAVVTGEIPIGGALKLAAVTEPIRRGAVALARQWAKSAGKSDGNPHLAVEDLDEALDEVAKSAAREVEREQTITHWKAKGVSLRAQPAKGWSPVTGYDDGVEFSKHVKAGCAGAVPNDHMYGAGVDYYCTDPKSHPRPKPRKSREEELAKRTRSLCVEAQQARRAWIQDSGLLKKTHPAAAVIELLANGLVLGHQNALSRQIAADWLSIAYVDLSATYEAGNAEQRQRIALAEALSLVEYAIDAQWGGGGWGQPHVLRYFALLEKHGYQLTEFEAEKLDEARPAGGMQTAIDDDAEAVPA